MSILIHDMVMPQNCDECPFPHVTDNEWQYHCPFDTVDYSHKTNVLFSKMRQPWCPLVEVEDNE